MIIIARKFFSYEKNFQVQYISKRNKEVKIKIFIKVIKIRKKIYKVMYLTMFEVKNFLCLKFF